MDWFIGFAAIAVLIVVLALIVRKKSKRSADYGGSGWTPGGSSGPDKRVKKE